MNFSLINWLAVIVCTVVTMGIGGAWFGPKTFFPIWWKAIGKSDAQEPGGSAGSMGITWALIVLASFVQAVFMSLFVNVLGSLTGGPSLASGALAGFLLWLGFVAPAGLTNHLFAGRLKAWILEAGNQLVTYLIIGAIAGWMG